MSDNMKVDWTQPIEAVHEDGRVVAVKPSGIDGCFVTPDLEGGWFSFREDGTHFVASCPWRIRNVQPATQAQTLTAQEHLARMEALVRRMAALNPVTEVAMMHTQEFDEARALVAEMEPVVDADLIEARRMVADQYGNSSNVSHLVASALSGDGDEWFHTKVALAAIRRGRELARQTGCPKES